MTAREAIAYAKAIIIAMDMGSLTYDEAKEKCEPYLKIANEQLKVIAKKYKKKPIKISFASFRHQPLFFVQ